jgi:hypothetical protein
MSSSREVLELRQQLEKAAAKGDASKIKDVLNVLTKNAHSMTLSLLKTTQVGVAVAGVRKHEDAAVSTTAKLLLKTWKQIAGTGSPRSAGGDAKAGARPSAEKAKAGGGAADLKAKAPAKAAYSKMPPTTGNTPRMGNLETQFSQKFATTCMDVGGADADAAGAIGEDVAGALCREFSQRQDQLDKFRSLQFNFKKNKVLLERLISGDLTGEIVVAMTAEEMATAEQKSADKAATKEIQEELQLDWEDQNEEKIKKVIPAP